MIRHILRKDWQLLWPIVTLTTLIQLCLAWVQYSSYRLSVGSASVPQLTTLLTIAWYAAIAGTTVAVVQRDAIPSLDQDWLIRPLRRRDLLLAKLLFVVVTIVAPMLLLDFARVTAMGFAPSASLPAIAIKESLVIVYLLIPVMAVATTASGMTELLIIGAAVALVYSIAQSAATFILGDRSCPTCGSSVRWIQHLWQHIAILSGALVILGLQYYRRATAVSRSLLIVGALVLALAQLPWNAAFAIQRSLSPVPGSASQVSIALVSRPAQAERANHVDSAPGVVDRAGGGLLRGKLERADKYVRGLVRAPHIPLRVELPIRIAGLNPDDLLHVDRAEMVLSNGTGRRVFDGAATDTLTIQGPPPPPQRMASAQPGLQTFTIPMTRDWLLGATVRLEMHDSLTLMHVRARFEIAALDGQLQAAEVGGCTTKLDQADDAIELTCLQLRRRPICLSATLYGPNGEHNPEVLNCDPDYRPNIPPPTDVLNVYGVEVPVRDSEIRYAVDPAQLTRAYLLIKIFSVREHFMRSAVLPQVRLTDYVGIGSESNPGP